MQVEERIRTAISNAGIPLFGIAKAVRPAHFDQYLAWLSAGGHAGMAYLAQPGSVFKRSEPASLLENAKSILVFGFPYPHDRNEKTFQEDNLWGKIASFAVARDYHLLIPEILERIIPEIAEIVGYKFQYRIFTDSAPILERDIAQSAGLGWIGRNGCLISPQFGSFFLLAEIFCDLDLQPTQPFTANRCGNCRNCLMACPTDCILENHTIASDHCISYLTIENKGIIPIPLRPALGNRIFGCDVCQQVCPWNQKTPAMVPLPEFENDRLSEWIDLMQTLRISKEQFKIKFGQYPLLRAKRSGLLRNALVAIGNAHRSDSVAILKDFLEHEQDALLRRHAVWALGNCAIPPDAAAVLQHQLSIETDSSVQEEIRLMLASL